MNTQFDMETFLGGVLTGSHVTRQRHLRQARVIQAATAEQWQRETPWGWKQKHLTWFLDHRMSNRSVATRFYYALTVKLLVRRLEMSWDLNRRAGPNLPCHLQQIAAL